MLLVRMGHWFDSPTESKARSAGSEPGSESGGECKGGWGRSVKNHCPGER